MRRGMVFHRFFLAMIAVALFAYGHPEVVRADGYYEYYSTGYSTGEHDQYESGNGWYFYSYSTAEYDNGSASAGCTATAGASISSGESSYYKSASVSDGSYAESTVGYEWHADPFNPTEVPPGGTFGYSLTASGSASAFGSSWLSGDEYHFSGECSAGGYSTGGGSASPGGGAGGSGCVSGGAQNNEYSCISWDYDPEGSVNSAYTGDGYFEVAVSWSMDDSDDDIPVEQGTTSVSGSAASGSSGGACGSGYWNGQTEGSAGGYGSGSADTSSSISISF